MLTFTGLLTILMLPVMSFIGSAVLITYVQHIKESHDERLS